MNRCTCGKYHCQTCHNQIDDGMYCHICNKQWTGKEKIISISFDDLFDIYETDENN